MVRVYLKGIYRKEKLAFSTPVNEVIVTVKGHAGYNEKGKDIVCASVSTLIQTAERALLKTAGVKHSITKNKDNFSFSFIVNQLSSLQQQVTLIILDTMLIGIEEIAKQYPRFVEIEYK